MATSVDHVRPREARACVACLGSHGVGEGDRTTSTDDHKGFREGHRTMIRWILRIFWGPPPTEDVSDEALTRARTARVSAEREFEKIKEQRGEVQRIAESLRSIRRANHLVEAFERTLRERRHPNHG